MIYFFIQVNKIKKGKCKFNNSMKHKLNKGRQIESCAYNGSHFKRLLVFKVVGVGDDLGLPLSFVCRVVNHGGLPLALEGRVVNVWLGPLATARGTGTGGVFCTDVIKQHMKGLYPITYKYHPCWTSAFIFANCYNKI